MSLSKPSSYASVMRYDTDIEKLPTLHRYVWKGKLEKILKFLSDEEHQWKVNKKDDYQRTPLHLASSKGDVKIVQFLLSIDVKSINCLDNDGCTPFYKAAQILSLDCMEALVSFGARTTCIDFKKNSIMDKIIFESGDGATQCLQYLLTNQKQEARSRDGVKLLHAAVKYGRPAVVKMLIQLGTDVNAIISDQSNKTPLMKSVENKYFTIAQLLLKNNADVYLKDENGKGVKDYAKKNQRFYKLIEEYDNTHYELNEPTTNQVFVKFHKLGTADNRTKQTQQPRSESLSGDLRAGLMLKIAEIESEIKRQQDNIKIEQNKSDELSIELNEIETQRTKAETKATKSATNIKEFKRPKVMFKKMFKLGYFTQEEWVEYFDALVEKYDHLQRGYEKLLLVETEKELEIEECIEMLQNARDMKLREKKNICKDMQRELEQVKTEIEKISEEKNLLKSKIEELKILIPQEKSKFKNSIQKANIVKSKLMNTLEILKVKKRGKMEELQVYIKDEEMIVKDIEECVQVLNKQKNTKIKLVNKIKHMKRKCGEQKLKSAKDIAQ